MQAGETASFGVRAAFVAGWRLFAARPWFWIRIEVLVSLLATGGALLIGAVLFGLLRLAGVSDPPLLVIATYVLTGICLWSVLLTQLILGKVWIDLRAVDGETPTAGDLFAKSHLVWRFMAGYCVFATAVGIGFLLLVVPGVWLMLRWCCWAPAMVDRDQGVLASFAESERLTRGRRLKLLAYFAAAVALILVATILMHSIVGMVLPSSGDAVAGFLDIVLSWIYYPVLWLSFTWLYRRLGDVDAGTVGPAPAE